MKNLLSRHSSFALLALAALCACSNDDDSVGGTTPPGGGPPVTGKVAVELTDAPFEHAILAAARIRIERVTVHVQDDDTGGFETLYEGPPIEIDLAPLVGGVTAPLALAELPTGTWRQVRLYPAGATLELTNGNVYSTEAGTLKLPSAMQSGFKVFLEPPLEVLADADHTVVVDFDLTKTFVPIPANDPENATHYQMLPVLRAENHLDGGHLTGFVSADDGTGVNAPQAGATVYVLPGGATINDPDAALYSTATGIDGAFSVQGIAAGTYQLLAHFGEQQATAGPVDVTSGATTQVELALVQ